MTSLIELAAQRLEQLRQAGIEVPEPEIPPSGAAQALSSAPAGAVAVPPSA